MKILFIYPNAGSQLGFNYGIAHLSAVLKEAGHEAALWQLCEDIAPLPSENEQVHTISMGGVLDDIADLVSFCIAPAWIFYIVFSPFSDPLVEKIPIALIAWGYAALGLVRLIYFTLDKNPIPGFFKGMPTPAAAMLSVAPLIIFAQAVNEGSPWTQFWGIFSTSGSENGKKTI